MAEKENEIPNVKVEWKAKCARIQNDIRIWEQKYETNLNPNTLANIAA